MSLEINNTMFTFKNHSCLNNDCNYWALVLILFPIFTVFGNILVILSVYREKILQTTTNYFIVSLAVADLLVAILVMPFAVYVLVNRMWALSPLSCDFYIAMDVTCSTSSIFNLVAISIDRYIAVTRPIKYAKQNNKKRAYLTIILVWIISAAIGSPIALGLNNTPDRIPDSCVFYNSDFIIYSSLSSFYIPCIIMIFLYFNIFRTLNNRMKSGRLNAKNKFRKTKINNNQNMNTKKVICDQITVNCPSNSMDEDEDENKLNNLNENSTDTIIMESQVGKFDNHSNSRNSLKVSLSNKENAPFKTDKRKESLSVLNKVTTYNKTNRSIRKKREKSSVKKEKKATITLAIVLGVFLVCWIPFFTCNIMDAICSKLNIGCQPGFTAFLITTWLGYMNSFVNPIIYTIFNLEFRKAFKKIMHLT